MNCSDCNAPPCRWPMPRTVLCAECLKDVPLAEIDPTSHERGNPTCCDCLERKGLVRCPQCREYYDATDYCRECGYVQPDTLMDGIARAVLGVGE